MYVNTVSQGNFNELSSSNFKQAKQKEPVRLVAPFIKSVNQGDNACILVAVIDPIKGAKALNRQIVNNPITDTTEWETYGDTRTKFEFANLEQGQKYWIRVVAVGSNGQFVQSMVVARYVMQHIMAAAKAA